jgi:anti-sigma regulatory factor (Ser/Thr protein kinase)
VAALEIELAAHPDAAPEARTRVRRELADSVPAPLLYDLLTVISELVTNASQHGDPGPVRVLLDLTRDGAVFGEVVNKGEGRPVPTEMDGETLGLGLHIVDAISETWTASTDDGFTRVRFVLQPP